MNSETKFITSPWGDESIKYAWSPSDDYVEPNIYYNKTEYGLIIMDFSIDFNINTIFQQKECPKCKSETINNDGITFKCNNCDFFYYYKSDSE